MAVKPCSRERGIGGWLAQSRIVILALSPRPAHRLQKLDWG
jgi:hypothetical protein